MLRTRSVILLSFVLAFLPIAGCATRPATQPISLAAEGVAGIVAHTESAERDVQNAVPHTDATGKVHLSAASDEHGAILIGATKTRAALDAADKQAKAAAEALSNLEGRWYVRWGRWIEHALWIIGLSWLALGVAAMFLGMGNPLSWTAWLGEELVRLLPMMNPFSWVRAWITAHRTGAAPAKEA